MFYVLSEGLPEDGEAHTLKTSASAGAMAAVGNKHCIVDFPPH